MSPRSKPEPVQVIKQRRDAALQSLVSGVPYIQFMGFRFDRRGDELTGVMPYQDMLIGNSMLPAIHGGAGVVLLGEDASVAAVDAGDAIALVAAGVAVADATTVHCIK